MRIIRYGLSLIKVTSLLALVQSSIHNTTKSIACPCLQRHIVFLIANGFNSLQEIVVLLPRCVVSLIYQFQCFLNMGLTYQKPLLSLPPLFRKGHHHSSLSFFGDFPVSSCKALEPVLPSHFFDCRSGTRFSCSLDSTATQQSAQA